MITIEHKSTSSVYIWEADLTNSALGLTAKSNKQPLFHINISCTLMSTAASTAYINPHILGS